MMRFMSSVSLPAFILAGLFALFAFAPSGEAQNAFSDPSARAGAATGTGLVAKEEEIRAGDISIGSTAQVLVIFRNEGSQPVKTAQVFLYPSSGVSAKVGMDQCRLETLPSGAECAIALEVKGLQPGPWRIDFLLRHDGRTRQVSTTVTGTVQSTGDANKTLVSDVQPLPEKLDFGTLKSSKPLVRSVVLRNVTSNSLEIKNVNIFAPDQGGYSLDTDCEKLDPGEACIATVTWAPTQKGPSDAVLNIQHTGPTSVTSVPLTGIFEPEEVKRAEIFPEAVPGKGLLVSSQDEIDFGTSVGSEAAFTVSLVNVGDNPVTIGALDLSGTDNGISVIKRGCKVGTSLEPIEACPLTLSWNPVREGAILDDITIRHDGARGVLVLPIKGTSTAIVSKDSQAIVTRDGELEKTIDKSQSLQGFIVTSHASTRAIISGPGGSRVVISGKKVVLGGVSWTVQIVPSGVEFIDGKDKVTLLFDRSLSSVNRNAGQSDSGTTTAAPAAPAAGAGP